MKYSKENLKTVVEHAIGKKYWVGHNNNNDDVYLDTASKERFEALYRTIEKFGEGTFWDEGSGLQVSLIEINLVGGL